MSPAIQRAIVALCVLAGLACVWTFPWSCRFDARRAEHQAAFARSNLDTLALTIEVYWLERGELPSSLVALEEIFDEFGNDDREVIRRASIDPWGRAFHFRVDSATRIVLWTLGEDGRAGGAGADADIEWVVDVGR